MQKLSAYLSGFGVIGSLLAALWLTSAKSTVVPSAIDERPAAPTRAAPSEARPAAAPSAPLAPNIAASAGSPPMLTAHALIEAMSEGEDEAPIDLAWEERLSNKPPSVVEFFRQPSVTFAEWTRAYRADLCACTSWECVTALQDDFVSRAPPFTDMLQDEATNAEIRAAILCANRHTPPVTETAALAAGTSQAERTDQAVTGER